MRDSFSGLTVNSLVLIDQFRLKFKGLERNTSSGLVVNMWFGCKSVTTGEGFLIDISTTMSKRFSEYCEKNIKLYAKDQLAKEHLRYSFM